MKNQKVASRTRHSRRHARVQYSTACNGLSMSKRKPRRGIFRCHSGRCRLRRKMWAAGSILRAGCSTYGLDWTNFRHFLLEDIERTRTQ
jgi:hypothetical protein